MSRFFMHANEKGGDPCEPAAFRAWQLLLRLEEDPETELNVTRRSGRAIGSQRPEVLVVVLPDTVELVLVQLPDVERERIGRGEAFRQPDVEEVVSQATSTVVQSGEVHVHADLRDDVRARWCSLERLG